jgi:hypothetical protein
LNHCEDVIEGFAYTVRPVFEVDADHHAPTARVANGLFDRLAVLLGGHPQLLAAVAFRTLGEQVECFAPDRGEPIDGLAAVAVTQHLDLL